LTREEVEKTCTKYGEVQDALDETYAEVVAANPGLDRGRLGTRWHVAMMQAMSGKENLRPEVSYKDGEKEPDKGDNSDYGAPGTIRPDLREIVMGGAVERLRPGAACFYEYSIGQRYMGPDRPLRIATMTRNAFPDVTKIVVVQMRPRGWRPDR
jgi:hypothetical protein